MRQCVVIALLMSCALTAAAQQTPANPVPEAQSVAPAPPIRDQTDTVAVREKQLETSDILKLPPCSLAKVNGDCKYVINRGSPMAPTQIQMFSGKKVTVVVKNEKYYERYFLDPVSGQLALNPDTAGSIIQGMLPALGKLNLQRQVTDSLFIYTTKHADPCDETVVPKDLTNDDKLADNLLAFKVCLAKLGRDAKSIYGKLEPYTAPDAITPTNSPTIESPKAIGTHIDIFIATEVRISALIKAISDGKKTETNPKVLAAVAELLDYQKPADALAADLLGYRTRINDLVGFSNDSVLCNTVIKGLAKGDETECVAVTSNMDDVQPYQGMVTRTITYAMDSYNLVSYSQQAAVDPSKKKALGGNIVVNFADEPNIAKSPALRWEASAGVFFSSLPIRSFSVLPKFDGTNVTDNVVAQTILRPTVVPYAAGNYRLTNDLRWSKWKSNLYLTGAVGINPNTVSADFAAGMSLSWRSLMVSPLWHYGHDTRLVGFTVGESLGAAFKSTLPTQSFWTSAFGIGIGIRIPPITGR
jgi:hypothetical protein